MQQRLKAARRTARTWVVASKLLKQLLVSVNDTVASLHARLATGTPYAACSSVRKEASSLALLPTVPTSSRAISNATIVTGSGPNAAQLFAIRLTGSAVRIHWRSPTTRCQTQSEREIENTFAPEIPVTSEFVGPEGIEPST